VKSRQHTKHTIGNKKCLLSDEQRKDYAVSELQNKQAAMLPLPCKLVGTSRLH